MSTKQGNLTLYSDIEFNGSLVKVFRDKSVSKKTAKKFLDQYVNAIKNGNVFTKKGKPVKIDTGHLDFIIIEKESVVSGYKEKDVEPSKILYLNNLKLDGNVTEILPTQLVGNYDHFKKPFTVKYIHEFYTTSNDNK